MGIKTCLCSYSLENKALFVRSFEFSGRKAHWGRRKILNTKTPLILGWEVFVLGGQGAALLKCKEVGMVNFKHFASAIPG